MISTVQAAATVAIDYLLLYTKNKKLPDRGGYDYLRYLTTAFNFCYFHS